MIGAGTIINPIIKIVTTVAILAAIYFFFVKPVLDTTNDVFENSGLGDLSNLPASIQDQVDSAFEGANTSDSRRLTDCIQRVAPDTDKIQACVNRLG